MDLNFELVILIFSESVVGKTLQIHPSVQNK
jgi:hypothetical protein